MPESSRAEDVVVIVLRSCRGPGYFDVDALAHRAHCTHRVGRSSAPWAAGSRLGSAHGRGPPAVPQPVSHALQRSLRQEGASSRRRLLHVRAGHAVVGFTARSSRRTRRTPTAGSRSPSSCLRPVPGVTPLPVRVDALGRRRALRSVLLLAVQVVVGPSRRGRRPHRHPRHATHGTATVTDPCAPTIGLRRTAVARSRQHPGTVQGDYQTRTRIRCDPVQPAGADAGGPDGSG